MLVARELGLDVGKLGDVTGLFGDALADEAEVTIDPRGTRASLAAPWPHDADARARIAEMLGERIHVLEQRKARPVIELVLDGGFLEVAATSHAAAPLAEDVVRASRELPAFARESLRRLAGLLVDPAHASQCDGVRSTASGLALRFRRTDDAATLAALIEAAGELGVTAAQRKLVEDIHPVIGRQRTTVLSLHACETGLALEVSWPDIAWENVVRVATGLYGKAVGARIGALAGASGAPHASALHLLLGDREPPRALVSARIVATDSVQ